MHRAADLVDCLPFSLVGGARIFGPSLERFNPLPNDKFETLLN